MVLLIVRIEGIEGADKPLIGLLTLLVLPRLVCRRALHTSASAAGNSFREAHGNQDAHHAPHHAPGLTGTFLTFTQGPLVLALGTITITTQHPRRHHAHAHTAHAHAPRDHPIRPNGADLLPGSTGLAQPGLLPATPSRPDALHRLHSPTGCMVRVHVDKADNNAGIHLHEAWRSRLPDCTTASSTKVHPNLKPTYHARTCIRRRQEGPAGHMRLRCLRRR